jgi:hypothetical protein
MFSKKGTKPEKDKYNHLYSFSLPLPPGNGDGYLFDLFFADGTPFIHKWHEKNGGTTDVNVDKWSKKDAVGMKRIQNFKVIIPGYGPRAAVETQTWTQVDERTFCFEGHNKISGVPAASEFRVRFVFDNGKVDADCGACMVFAIPFPMSDQISKGATSSLKDAFINMVRNLDELMNAYGHTS